MFNKVIISVAISFLIASCNSPLKPGTNEEKPLRIVTLPTIKDTIINYGCYPVLPPVLNVVLDDNSQRQLYVNWFLPINPVLPGTYYATSHLAISEQGILDDSVTFSVTVKNTDSTLTIDRNAGRYLGDGYDTAYHFVGAAINPDSMAIYEKPINQFQYIYRVIETEKDRQKFCENLDDFLGFQANVATTPLAEGQIEIVSVFYYRYKTYFLQGNLKFLTRFADSLYQANRELFSIYYGKMYSQQATLFRYSMCDMIVYPNGLQKQDLSSAISHILETMILTSTKLMDLSKFTLKYASAQSSFQLSSGLRPWFGLKSTNQYFMGFKSEVDSTLTTREYNTGNKIYKNY